MTLLKFDTVDIWMSYVNTFSGVAPVPLSVPAFQVKLAMLTLPVLNVNPPINILKTVGAVLVVSREP